VVASGDQATVRSNRFLDNGADSMSFERTGGTVASNFFVHSSDDCIDVDGPKVVLIENNICTRAGDDGVEIRNFDYAGPVTLTTVLRVNTIVAAGEDGVQIIDYQATSNRVYRLERNLIRNSIGVGLGIMGNGQTVEDFSGYSMLERVYVLNNTFDGNSYAITGGDNLVALNNIFTNATMLGLKNVDGKSVAKYSLFYGNAADQQASNVIASENVTADPLYLDRTGGDLGLRDSSPAIDAGTATYVHLGEAVLAYPAGSYAGSGPDLGAFETETASAAWSASMPRSARRERQAATR
jgi:Right handed beta helix region